MESFTKSLPEVKKRLIDERDIYLAQKIRNAPGRTIVAIVGAGHLAGIERHIYKEVPMEGLIEVPQKSIIPSLLKWAIPTLIVILFMIGFFKGGTQHSIQSIYIWILVNGILSAVGAAVALAHPLTIAVSFIAAPITSLNTIAPIVTCTPQVHRPPHLAARPVLAVPPAKPMATGPHRPISRKPSSCQPGERT